MNLLSETKLKPVYEWSYKDSKNAVGEDFSRKEGKAEPIDFAFYKPIFTICVRKQYYEFCILPGI